MLKAFEPSSFLALQKQAATFVNRANLSPDTFAPVACNAFIPTVLHDLSTAFCIVFNSLMAPCEQSTLAIHQSFRSLARTP